MAIANPEMAAHRFLAAMYQDPYFPDHLVDKAAAILRGACERIEAEHPADLEELYALTQDATDELNALQVELAAAGSAIETVAREAIAEDFSAIAKAYGFDDADVEELIAARDW
ncbi:hypothetical protein KDL01_12950 [Actinospica durhamensis]|uniref:Uncharacterized protein n=1 Tax=Actinospica durhamensis TaxID=1508375 RepID=A0A941ITB3_9ACTN|nr:DUF5713 family protein [Actinospica durhamensis]MBR7834176.1 hypothetical protein [Actinospica durhamensis]